MKLSQGLKRALFLDRDGVVNIEKNYVHKISDFEFMDGIFSLCRLAIKDNMALVVVTNQAGIGRGYYSEADFHLLTDWMQDRFITENAPLSGVYFCPYHPIYGIGKYKRESFDRKPNPGMLIKAAHDLNLDIKNSILIGDNNTDIQAAKTCGVGTTILLTTCKSATAADFVVASLLQAQEILFPQQN